jgi:hypothetical protein
MLFWRRILRLDLNHSILVMSRAPGTKPKIDPSPFGVDATMMILDDAGRRCRRRRVGAVDRPTISLIGAFIGQTVLE